MRLPPPQELVAPLNPSKQIAAIKSGFSCQRKPHRARRTQLQVNSLQVNSKQIHPEINENGRGLRRKPVQPKYRKEVNGSVSLTNFG